MLFNLIKAVCLICMLQTILASTIGVPVPTHFFTHVFSFPSMLHSRVLGEQTQLKEEMETLRRDNAQLVREHNHLKQNCEELKRLHSQDQKELADLRLQQQQVQCPHTHIQTHTRTRGCLL